MELATIIHYMGDMLGRVISEQESPLLFETEERIRALAKARRGGDTYAAERLAYEASQLTADMARGIATAFTLYFDIANLAEEAQRVHILRERERMGDPMPVDDSIAEAILILKQKGLTSSQVDSLLRKLHIELVITAHPTEAKRRTILSSLKRISDIVKVFYESEPLPRERSEFESMMLSELSVLWLTRRFRTNKPAVTDEVRTGLYFVDEVFWDALPMIYESLDAALTKYYPDITSPTGWLTIASWIGGDRDGNPNVTAEVTAETLRLHRGLAVERHRRLLQDLSRRLSINGQRVPSPEKLTQWLDSRRPWPEHVAYLEGRYANEPYRHAVALLVSDLEEASQENVTHYLLSDTPHKASLNVEDLRGPLDMIASALPTRLTNTKLKSVQYHLDIFGLHCAHLDLREDSSRLRSALGEILLAIGFDTNFESKDEKGRLEVLIKLLREHPERPNLLARTPGVTSASAETWSLFRLISRVHNVYGGDLLKTFIISMCRGAADVLTVLLLAKWSGCADGFSIVPLFETMDDLHNASDILENLFTTDAYHEHLSTCGWEQMVMIGYSDSNKDGGFLAANWALYQSQEEIAEVCGKNNIRLTLFHGRGGSVARGGGPANRAIRAQPPGTLHGRFRLTEQGENIASRYSNFDLAHRHLEQIANAVILASAKDEYPSINGKTHKNMLVWRNVMEKISAASLAAYRKLVYETPGFTDYWRSATPIDEINRLSIGSRPSSRGGSNPQVTKIRAIPWVFSWMQSRYNFPGWYGLGSGLAEEDPIRLKEIYEEWPFFKALLDNAEMAILKADMEIAQLYSDLTPDKELANRIFTSIQNEYDRTRDSILAITSHEELMDSDPIIQRSIKLRNPYVDPLNYLQVEILRRLRSLPDPNAPEAEELREVIDVTISGIASGLRNTG